MMRSRDRRHWPRDVDQHKIIQMMGGDIKVESEYGKGSRFTIDMPLVCRDQKPDDKIEVEGLEVLVVDDDKIACLNTSSCLREIGINSECVYSGSEAIEKYDSII